MASLWSKFKISYEERKEKKLFKVAEQELKNMNVNKNVKQLVLKQAEDLLIQNLDDNRTDEDESENEVSLMSKFKLSYKEGKKLKGLVKELEKVLEYKMSHEDVKAYARIVLNINSGNLAEKLKIIEKVIRILNEKLDENDNEEDTKDTEEEEEDLLGERVSTLDELLNKITENKDEEKTMQEREQKNRILKHILDGNDDEECTKDKEEEEQEQEQEDEEEQEQEQEQEDEEEQEQEDEEEQEQEDEEEEEEKEEKEDVDYKKKYKDLLTKHIKWLEKYMEDFKIMEEYLMETKRKNEEERKRKNEEEIKRKNEEERKRKNEEERKRKNEEETERNNNFYII